MSAADQEVRRGCYLCLQSALSGYQRAMASPRLRLPATLRAATTAALLTARERELGIAGADGRRAERLLASLPSPEPAATYARIASSVAPHAAGVAKETLEDPDADWKARRKDDWAAVLQPLEARARLDPVAAYFLLTAACTHRPEVDREPLARAALEWHPTVPLVLYRAALCTGDAELWERLLAAEPRYGEAQYFLGRHELGQQRLLPAEGRLAEAVSVLPGLSAGWATLGGVRLALEDFESALGDYDHALALVPGHREALLGKAKCLSELERHEDAVSSLERLKSLGYWYLGDANYWLAWNELQLGRLGEAAGHAQEAKHYLPGSGDLFRLSGIIQFQRSELEPARQDLEFALSRNSEDCDARFYLAAIASRRKEWFASAKAFADATACYGGVEAGLLARRHELDRWSDLAAARRARRLARIDRQIASASRSAATAAFDAAAAYINAGRPDLAPLFLDQAAGHQEFRTRAEEVRKKIERPATAPR